MSRCFHMGSSAGAGQCLPRAFGVTLAVAAALALAACAADTNPVRDVFVATGIGVEKRQGGAFIVDSRPTDPEYMPVGVSAAPRADKAKDANKVKAAEAEMDKRRATNETEAVAARQLGATPAAVAPVVAPLPPETPAPEVPKIPPPRQGRT